MFTLLSKIDVFPLYLVGTVALVLLEGVRVCGVSGDLHPGQGVGAGGGLQGEGPAHHWHQDREVRPQPGRQRARLHAPGETEQYAKW